MVVYQIPCSCGQVYVGKTIQGLETRLKEHKDACCKSQNKTSAIAEHAWQQDHPIDLEDTTILDNTSRHKELLLKEA